MFPGTSVLYFILSVYIAASCHSTLLETGTPTLYFPELVSVRCSFLVLSPSLSLVTHEGDSALIGDSTP